jgi:glycosyltransferase involved in cell wall biosynthesis
VRICLIGKFPPIQGGVSARTYWTAHGLAARGHEVHVVTNAKEARPPFRMHMRQQDWQRCEATYGVGSVTVHWSDPVDRSQSYIPMASPFVSKLASLVANVHSERPFDVIHSYYLEPYGIAGHLAAEMTRVPHVVRMAGSDAGRLWHHPQFEALYDHVLQSAAIVIAGSVAGRAIRHGVRPERIAAAGGFEVPENLFCPEGPELDLAALRQEVEADSDFRDLLWGGFAGGVPYFGIYGKLGETKGSFALLAAMQRLKQAGVEVGLLAMAHGWPAIERRFRSRAEELGLADRILQIPFLPHWRVPEFLRSCLGVCCLEQDFPIVFHTPVIALEVLTSGACLIGSTEVIRKLPDCLRVPHGYGCVAIEDVQDIETLSTRLAAIARDPEPIASVAARGRAFARAVKADASDPDGLERILKSAMRRRIPPKRERPAVGAATEAEDPRFPVTQLAAQALREKSETEEAGGPQIKPGGPVDLPQARDVLAAAERGMDGGDSSLRPVVAAIRLEIAIAEAESAADTAGPAEAPDPLFRLRTKRWAMLDGDLAGLVPVRDPQLRMTTFDVSELRNGRTGPPSRTAGAPRSRHVAAFAQVNGERREPLFVSDQTARILALSDGTRTVLEIAKEVGSGNRHAGGKRALRQIEELFVSGLLWLQEAEIDRSEAYSPSSAQIRR